MSWLRSSAISRSPLSKPCPAGYSLPHTVTCVTLAGLTGVPLVRVPGTDGEARAVSREEKAVWRKPAATSMALCLGADCPTRLMRQSPGLREPTLHALCEIIYQSTAAFVCSALLSGE